MPQADTEHSDLFEADITTIHPTSGSAALHPRLRIAGLFVAVMPRGYPLSRMAHAPQTYREASGPKGAASLAGTCPAACALYGKPLMRTATDARLPALFPRVHAAFLCVHAADPSLHPMDFHFHPMDRPIQGMEFPIQGLFSEENGGRFVPYSGEIRVFGRTCGRASHGCV